MTSENIFQMLLSADSPLHNTLYLQFGLCKETVKQSNSCLELKFMGGTGGKNNCQVKGQVTVAAMMRILVPLHSFQVIAVYLKVRLHW